LFRTLLDPGVERPQLLFAVPGQDGLLALDPGWSSWRLEWGWWLIAGSSDDDEMGEPQLRELVGRQIQQVALRYPRPDGRLEFAGGWVLTFFAETTEPAMDWIVTQGDETHSLLVGP
jgi:hypothetical protein